MKFGSVPTSEALNAILAHSMRLPDGTRLKKGMPLSATNIEALLSADIAMITVARLQKGDIGENEAALKISQCLTTPNIKLVEAGTGRVNLYAKVNGVFRADKTLVNQLNLIDPAITFATLVDQELVEQGRMVATVKIIPYAVSGEHVAAGCEIAGRGLVSIAAYQQSKVGLISTCLPSLKTTTMDKTLSVLKSRLEPSGSILTREIRCDHTQNAVAEAICDQLDGNDLLILFGASAISDEADVLPAAIRKAGGTVTRFGMPVDPGNLMLLGEIKGKPVIGAPGCARSPAENGFDWILSRTLAGIKITADDIAQMGVGGLLMEIGSRPSPREASTTEEMQVTALVLAAGQSRRMGKANKMLVKLHGQQLVTRVSEAALGSSAEKVTVVTGHQADQVTKALPKNAATVFNPDYKQGLSSSLAKGISSLPETASHALILLGDMPEITSAMMDQMIDAASSAPHNAIIMASNNGKRGNPVLWPRAYFSALQSISGDVGARHLIEANRELVVEVELGEAASFDLDTPQALERAGGEI